MSEALDAFLRENQLRTVKDKNAVGDSALHLAVLQNAPTELCDELIAELGVDPINNAHETPLFAAIRHNQTGMVRMLIRHRTHVNHRNKAGQTPLGLAVTSTEGAYKESILQLLLDQGAKILITQDTFQSTVKILTAFKGAERLAISTATVKNHFTSIKQKLDHETEKHRSNIRQATLAFHTLCQAYTSDEQKQIRRDRRVVNDITGELTTKLGREGYANPTDAAALISLVSKAFENNFMFSEDRIAEGLSVISAQYESERSNSELSEFMEQAHHYLLFIAFYCAQYEKNDYLNKAELFIATNPQYNCDSLKRLNSQCADRFQKHLKKLIDALKPVLDDTLKDFRQYFMTKEEKLFKPNMTSETVSRYGQTVLRYYDAELQRLFSIDSPALVAIEDLDFRRFVCEKLNAPLKGVGRAKVERVVQSPYQPQKNRATVATLFFLKNGIDRGFHTLHTILTGMAELMNTQKEAARQFFLNDFFTESFNADPLGKSHENVKREERKIAKELEGERREVAKRTAAAAASAASEKGILEERRRREKETYFLRKEIVQKGLKELASTYTKLLSKIFEPGDHHHEILYDEFNNLITELERLTQRLFKLELTAQGAKLLFADQTVTSYHRVHRQDGLDGNVILKFKEIFATLGIVSIEVPRTAMAAEAK